MGFDLAMTLLLFLAPDSDAVRGTPPKPGVCVGEGGQLVRAQPVRVGKKIRAPTKTRHVAPEFPELALPFAVYGWARR
jgi:hypothetical protein